MKYDEKTGVYCCQVDEQWFNLSVDLLRKALDITPVDPTHPFELPPTGDTVIDFINHVRYPEPVEFVSNIRVSYVYQPWRAILTLINQCLTRKTSGGDKPRHLVLQMLWGIVTQTNVDHAELLWEEFTQGIHTILRSHKASHKASLKDPKKKAVPLLIPYGRFTKMIIYYLGSTSDVHKRPESPCHLPGDDFLLGRDQAPHDSITGPSSQPKDDTSEKVVHESSSTTDSERTESGTEAAAPKDLNPRSDIHELPQKMYQNKIKRACRSDLEDTTNAHHSKVTAATMLKLILVEERPATPEPNRTIPPQKISLNQRITGQMHTPQRIKFHGGEQASRKTYEYRIPSSNGFAYYQEKEELCKARLEVSIIQPYPDVEFLHCEFRVQAFRKYGYKLLDRDNSSYRDCLQKKLQDLEKDFKPHPNDFEDLYLLDIQDKLNHLSKSDKIHLHTAVNMWIRNLVIRNRVGDLQLRIESYQTKLNLECPNWDATDYSFKEIYDCPESQEPYLQTEMNKEMLMRQN
ncbi:hypothetical protein Tco_0522865 [Tanacetum coccineum]